MLIQLSLGTALTLISQSSVKLFEELRMTNSPPCFTLALTCSFPVLGIPRTSSQSHLWHRAVARGQGNTPHSREKQHFCDKQLSCDLTDTMKAWEISQLLPQECQLWWATQTASSDFSAAAETRRKVFRLVILNHILWLERKKILQCMRAC